MVRSQDAGLTIGKLALAGGTGVETVRYYQRRGLLFAPEKPDSAGGRGGVRRYGEDDVRRLRFIRSAQASGFSLKEIAELIAFEAADDRKAARALARDRVRALDTQIATLTQARDRLQTLADRCGRQHEGPCPIFEAFVPHRSEDGGHRAL